MYTDIRRSYKMKLAFFEIHEDEKIDYFKQNLPEHELTFITEPLTETSLPQSMDFDIISTFVSSKVTSHVIDSLPSLKFITTRSTGFDCIDIAYAKNKNIPVSNVPAYGSHTVAEFTFGLILTLSRKINQGINRLKIGFDFNFEGLRGFDLNGKTLGVIGTGKIGTNVIKIAKGFNMKIIAFDAHPNQELAKTYGFSYFSLDDVLKNADIVTLHVPYSEQTRYLINRNNIFQMKKGVLFINTARGAVVETEALFQALMQGHLAGAALDVLEEENELKEEAELLADNKLQDNKFKNILKDHVLANLPQVVVTPHMAFYTKEAEFAILETTVKNITSFIQGQPENVVNDLTTALRQPTF